MTPPDWVHHFFNYPVTRLAYLRLISALLHSGGMDGGLFVGSLRDANEMPLALALELLGLMSHAKRETMRKSEAGGGSSGERMSISDLFDRG